MPSTLKCKLLTQYKVVASSLDYCDVSLPGQLHTPIACSDTLVTPLADLRGYVNNTPIPSVHTHTHTHTHTQCTYPACGYGSLVLHRLFFFFFLLPAHPDSSGGAWGWVSLWLHAYGKYSVCLVLIIMFMQCGKNTRLVCRLNDFTEFSHHHKLQPGAGSMTSRSQMYWTIREQLTWNRERERG